MTGTAYPGDAVTGVPTYTANQGRTSLAAAMGGATTARPLGGFTGVRPGPNYATFATAPTSTTWQILPFGGYIDLETSATNGGYFFSFLANETGTIVAAAVSARVDLLYVQINDSNTGDGSGLSPRVVTGYQQGVAGAGIPALSAARAFVVAQINVPASGGGSPTVTWVAPHTVAAGGILPALTLAILNTQPGGYVGQQAEVFSDATATNNMTYRWNGTAWKPWASPVFSYTPTLANITVGNGTLVASYHWAGGRVFCDGTFTLGSTSAMGTGPTIAHPVTAGAIHATSSYPLGIVTFLQTGVAEFSGAVNGSTSTVGAFRTWNATGTITQPGGVTASAPFTWAATHVLMWHYEILPA